MAYLIIPDELDERLTILAAKTHVPKNKIALRGLLELIEDQEDYLVAVEVLQRIRSGEEKVYSYEEVMREYEREHPGC